MQLKAKYYLNQQVVLKVEELMIFCVSCFAQLEYFMIQCLKHKAKERPEKRRGNKVNELRPPHLEQPGERNTLPVDDGCCCHSNSRAFVVFISTSRAFASNLLEVCFLGVQWTEWIVFSIKTAEYKASM